jgi:hypothetical protein
VREYLFNPDGTLRQTPFDVSPLHRVITKHEDHLVQDVVHTFHHNWPLADADIVTPERLRDAVRTTARELEDVLRTLKKRLDWCLDQMERLDAERRRRGTLDADEDALYARCDRLIKRLKGIERRRQVAEAYDEAYTYGVLAVEGFLPGYGLETGAIIGTALIPRYLEGRADFELPRPLAIGLREYVPGNLIYANGRRFVARYFHLEAQQPVLFHVDVGREAIREVGGAQPAALASLGAAGLKAVPICDVDLAHVSHISDEEDYRFQLPVAVYGYELGRHGKGQRYAWGERELLLRRGVHLRLVNVGAVRLLANEQLGYPVSLVSGQSRSPFASQRELEAFSTHQQERYGRPVEFVGFFADVVADALSLPDCASREEAYSLLEALRIGMSQVLDMERDDVDVLVIGRVGSDGVDALLYDPMPGGSGLLEQACERWAEMVTAALAVVTDCPSVCQRSCIDCLQTFRNAFVHRYLDRTLAAERLQTWHTQLTVLHEVPPRLPDTAPKRGAMPVNEAEARLRALLEHAGFPVGVWHHGIPLGRPLGSTTPDVFFPGDDDDPGVCLYLDGLSEHLHGNPLTAERDRAIRDELRARYYEVFEIPASELDDRDAMARHFYRLARVLLGKDKARDLRHDASWFDAAMQTTAAPSAAETAWDDVLLLLEQPWHPIARGLRDAGLPPPDEAYWDLMDNGRVTGQQALMVWHCTAGSVALVPEGEEVSLAGGHLVPVTPASPVDAVVAYLREHLKGTA